MVLLYTVSTMQTNKILVMQRGRRMTDRQKDVTDKQENNSRPTGALNIEVCRRGF